MPSEKICRAIAAIVTGEALVDGRRVPSSVAVFDPEAGHAAPTPIVIHPDENGEMWYWTPEPEPPLVVE